MNQMAEQFVEAAEEDFDKTLLVRMGKIVVVGLATALFSYIAEKQYDKITDRNQKGNDNAHS